MVVARFEYRPASVACSGSSPSFGRVPRDPFSSWDHTTTSVYGPLTRTVEDAALILDQVVGPSPGDPASLPLPARPYLDELREPLGRKLRLAWSGDLGYAAVQRDVAEIAEQAARSFETLGHTVELLEEPAPNCNKLWGALGNFELAGRLHEQLRERREDITRSFARALDGAWDMTPEAWGEAARQRGALNEWCANQFDRFDLLLTPTVPYDPPPPGGPFPTMVNGKEPPPAGVAAFTIPFNLSWHPRGVSASRSLRGRSACRLANRWS